VADGKVAVSNISSDMLVALCTARKKVYHIYFNRFQNNLHVFAFLFYVQKKLYIFKATMLLCVLKTHFIVSDAVFFLQGL